MADNGNQSKPLLELEDLNADNPEERLLTSSFKPSKYPGMTSGRKSSLTTGPSDPLQRWLLALHDPLSALYTFTSCMAFADIFNDGDMKLIVVDLGDGKSNIRMNVYRGTSLHQQVTLVDIPCGVCSFFLESGEGGPFPCLSVAAGSYLYIYKNLKPFYKFQVPCLPLNQLEVEAWTNVRRGDVMTSTSSTATLPSPSDILHQILSSIQESMASQSNPELQASHDPSRATSGSASASSTSSSAKVVDPKPELYPLTPRSMFFLQLNTTEERTSFIQSHQHNPLKRLNTITAVSTMKRSLSDDRAVSVIIIGTESKEVLFIEPDAFTVLSNVTLSSIPVLMDGYGLFEVEFRLIVSGRDGSLHSIKRGAKQGRLITQLASQPVGLVQVNGNILVACMDQSLHSYSTKGIHLWTVHLDANVTALESIEVDLLSVRLVAVALDNKTVVIYHDKHRVDCINTSDVVCALRFGKYGRESSTLVMVSTNGSLTILILKRTVKFYPKDIAPTPSAMSSTPKLSLPKKTKLFVDGTMRERVEYQEMHRCFSQDMYRLRLMTSRSYVKAMQSSLNPITSNGSDTLKLSAQVHGLGPVFKLVLELQNNSGSKPITQLYVTFHYDTLIYQVERTFIPIPYLVPGILYTFDVRVRCVSEMNVMDSIKVFVIKESDNVPTVSSIINMPASEAEI